MRKTNNIKEKDQDKIKAIHPGDINGNVEIKETEEIFFF